MDPQLQYLAGGYASVVSGDPKILASGVWEAFQNVQVHASLWFRSCRQTSFLMPHEYIFGIRPHVFQPYLSAST